MTSKSTKKFSGSTSVKVETHKRYLQDIPPLLWNIMVCLVVTPQEILAPQDIPAREFACTQETLCHKTHAHKRYHKRYCPHSTLTWHTTRHVSIPQDTSIKPVNLSCMYVLWHNFSYVLHVCLVCMSCDTFFHMSCGYILCVWHVCLGAQFYICLARMSCINVWIPLVCISCMYLL